MNEESLMKRTLVLTAKLVGVFTLWTLLVSVVVVGLTAHAVVVLSGGTSRAESATPAPTAHTNVIRPNG